jgi:hypothetical protein
MDNSKVVPKKGEFGPSPEERSAIAAERIATATESLAASVASLAASGQEQAASGKIITSFLSAFATALVSGKPAGPATKIELVIGGNTQP